MNIRKRVAKNTALLIILYVFNLLTGIFCLSFIARYLGATMLGKYSFVSSFYFFFLALLDFGISTVALREISREREQAGLLLSNLVTLKLFFSVFLSLLAVIIANSYPFPKDLRLALSLYSPILVIAALNSFQMIFDVELRQGYIVLASFLWRVFSLLFIILSIWLNLGLAAIVFSFVLAELIKTASIFLSSRKFVKIKIPTMDVNLWMRMAKAALPLGITSLLGSIMRNIDIFMLTRICGFAEVGLYSVAYRVYEMSLAIPIALMVSVFPLMSRFYKEDLNTLKRINQKTFDILSVCGVLLVVLVLVLADKIIILVFGPKYIESSFALRVLIFSAFFVYICIGSGTLLIVAGRQLVLMWFYVFLAIASILLNFLLIPRFGLRGAAVANAIVMLSQITLVLYFVSFKLKINLLITKFKKAALCGLITAAVLLYVRQFPLFVSITIGTLLYTSLIFMFKAVDKKDLVSLLELKV